VISKYTPLGVRLCLSIFVLSPLVSFEFLGWGQVVRLFAIGFGLYFLFFKNDLNEKSSALKAIFVLLGLFIAIEFDVKLYSNITSLHILYWGQWICLIFGSGLLVYQMFSLRGYSFYQIITLSNFDKLFLPILFFLFLLSILQFYLAGTGTNTSLSISLDTWFKLSVIYFLFSRFEPSFSQHEVLKILKICFFTFGVIFIVSLGRIFYFESLKSMARAEFEKKHFEKAAATYIDLINKNAYTLKVPFYQLSTIIALLSNDSLEGEQLCYFIRGKIRSQRALSYEEWDAVATDYETFINKKNIVNKSLRGQAFQAFGETLLSLKKWSKLTDLCDQSISEFPDIQVLYLQAVVAYAKVQEYNKAWAKLVDAAFLADSFDQIVVERFLAGKIRHIGEFSSLLPGSFVSYLSYFNFYELVSVLAHSDYNIIYTSEKVGKTKVYTSASVLAISKGTVYRDETGYNYRDGLASNLGLLFLRGEGNQLIGWARGYTILILNTESGQVEAQKTFDTYASRGASDALSDFVDGIPNGKIVVALAFDEASTSLTENGRLALAGIGAQYSLYSQYESRYGWAHAVIGVKGALPGQALEDLDPRSVSLSVLSGNVPNHWETLSDELLLQKLQSVTKINKKKALFLSGITQDSKISLLIDTENTQ
jgi:hypothetical protein